MRCFVATNTRLSRQKFACHDKIILVATNICRDKTVVATNTVAVQWQSFCRDKQIFVATNTCLELRAETLYSISQHSTTWWKVVRRKTCEERGRAYSQQPKRPDAWPRLNDDSNVVQRLRSFLRACSESLSQTTPTWETTTERPEQKSHPLLVAWNTKRQVPHQKQQTNEQTKKPNTQNNRKPSTHKNKAVAHTNID